MPIMISPIRGLGMGAESRCIKGVNVADGLIVVDEDIERPDRIISL